MKKVSLALIVVFSTLVGHTQVPDNPLGLTPASLKWNFIETDQVEVIFPQGLEKAGLRVANTVHFLSDKYNETVGDKRHKVSIILNNQSVRSNAFVTVGPFRSEFYLRPPQYHFTTDWLDALSIHEYQHVKQFANSKRGITNVVRSILGSWAWGGLAATALPRWFWEGDAVVAETGLTSSGRGRSPEFLMEFRALLHDEKQYGYEKAAAGSLIDFVPNWYHLGYRLTDHVNKEYGVDTWAGVLEDAVRYRGLFFPFARSVRRRTGKIPSELYNEVIREMSTNRRSTTQDRGSTLLTSNGRTVTHYTNPLVLDNLKIALESGYRQVPRLVTIEENGDYTPIVTTGALGDHPHHSFSGSGNLICWSEMGFHPRWMLTNYSNIVIYDVKKGSKVKLTENSRYFSPDLDASASRIVSIEIGENMLESVAILDAQTGEITQSFLSDAGLHLAYPRWLSDHEIAVIGQRDEKQAIYLLDIQNGESSALTDQTVIQLSHLTAGQDHVFFSAGFDGVNNIYAVDANSREIWQVTNDPVGAFHSAVSADGSTLMYSVFRSGGYELRELVLDQSQWTLYDGRIFISGEIETIIPEIPDQEFEIRKYSKARGLIFPHSLLPTASDPVYGLSLLSDNKLSTLSAEIGSFYDRIESQWTHLGSLTYAGWWPEIKASGGRIHRELDLFNLDVRQDSLFTNFYREEFRENFGELEMSMPLNLSFGNWIQQMRLSGAYRYTSTEVDARHRTSGAFLDTIAPLNEVAIPRLAPYEKPFLTDTDFGSWEVSFNYSLLQRRALQHLAPRLGVSTFVAFRQVIDDPLVSGKQAFLSATGYLPGFAATHHIYLTGIYQKQALTNNYKFPRGNPVSRGYDFVEGDEQYTVRFNYAFPVAYPDLALGPLAFVKRLKANVFYDYGKAKAGFPFDFERDLNSIGLEASMDVRLFRLLEVDWGIRYSYLLNGDFAPDGQQNQVQFFVSSISG
jgi:hypothetical protein